MNRFVLAAATTWVLAAMGTAHSDVGNEPRDGSPTASAPSRWPRTSTWRRAKGGFIPPLNPGDIVLTYDDGIGPEHRSLAAYLRSEGIPATFFVSTELLPADQATRQDGSPWLDGTDLQVSAQLGHFVGNHTVRHINLETACCTGGCDANGVYDQVAKAQWTLDKLVLPVSPKTFHLLRGPFGSWRNPLDCTGSSGLPPSYVTMAFQGSVGWTEVSEDGRGNPDSNYPACVDAPTMGRANAKQIEGAVGPALHPTGYVVLLLHQAKLDWTGACSECTCTEGCPQGASSCPCVCPSRLGRSCGGGPEFPASSRFVPCQATSTYDLDRAKAMVEQLRADGYMASAKVHFRIPWADPAVLKNGFMPTEVTGGAYLKSCTSCTTVESTLSCQCQDPSGHLARTELRLPCEGAIVNCKGKLTCGSC